MNIDDITKELRNSGLVLRDHQLHGIKALLDWNSRGHGGILADEMGLGKTCQGIIALTVLTSQGKGPNIVICPLSVLEHWENELLRFGCGQLKLLIYKGSKEKRAELRDEMDKTRWNVLLTTFDNYLKDHTLIGYDWHCMILDEAHRVKNDMSQMHRIISEKHVDFMVLFTGTPVQNNLIELYALLQLVDHRKFSPNELESFCERYKNVNKKEISDELKHIIAEYVVRRTKKDVLDEVPKASEVVLYHGITEIQKNVYKAILSANYEFFQENQKGFPLQSLQNVLMQLRKCVCHPYLFKGMEPTPFTEGEHLIESSGKTLVLDVLLNYCKTKGHKILLFSQFTGLLDIVQDILDMRGLKFVRIDGSIRGEERFHSIDEFQRPDSEVSIFLLSTKAGGVGLNLTAADTVIFLDSDFNPQNDLQAAARCHRIGQSKPVKIIRLVGRHTVEEIIKYRSERKLKLAEYILGEQSDAKKMSPVEFSELLLMGLSKLNTETSETASRTKAISDEDLESIIGRTDKNGLWELTGSFVDDKENKLDEEDKQEDELLSSKAMYRFEGHDYSMGQEQLKQDRAVLQELVDEQKTIPQNDTVRTVVAKISAVAKKSRNVLTEEEKVERRKKRRELEEKRKLEREKRREERKNILWKQYDYVSANLRIGMTTPPNLDQGLLYRIYGDVTKPERAKWDGSAKSLILHSVDSGGRFGTGGVFTALNNLSDEIKQTYELAGRMEDLNCGDVHLVKNLVQQTTESKTFAPEEPSPAESDRTTAPDSLKRDVSVALMVTQTLKDRYQRIIRPEILESCFNRISEWALVNSTFSVHMPMIWFGISNLSEAIVCDMVQECFCTKGIHAYIYHYRRGGRGRHLITQPQNAPVKNKAPIQISPVKASNQICGGGKTAEPLAKRSKTEPGAFAELEESKDEQNMEEDEFVPSDEESDEDFDDDLDDFIVDDDYVEYDDEDTDPDEKEYKESPKRKKISAILPGSSRDSNVPNRRRGLKKF